MLFENTNPVQAPHDPKYHLTEDIAEKAAIQWMRISNTLTLGKPFLLYFTPDAVHGPHHIFKELADNYDAIFDEGWAALRKMTFENKNRWGGFLKIRFSIRLQKACRNGMIF